MKVEKEKKVKKEKTATAKPKSGAKSKSSRGSFDIYPLTGSLIPITKVIPKDDSVKGAFEIVFETEASQPGVSPIVIMTVDGSLVEDVILNLELSYDQEIFIPRSMTSMSLVLAFSPMTRSCVLRGSYNKQAPIWIVYTSKSGPEKVPIPYPKPSKD